MATWEFRSSLRVAATADTRTRRSEYVSTPIQTVEVDGHTLRCRVTGSFQPLLDAVRGYEVLTLLARLPGANPLSQSALGKEGQA